MAEENEYYEEPTASHGEFRPSSANPTREQTEEKGSVKIEHGVVVNLPFCNLRNRTVTDLRECYLVLYNHFVIYKIVGKYEELLKDEQLETETWVPKKVNFRWTRMRKDLTDVTMFYDNEEKLYGVEMEFGKNMQSWYFVKGEDAKKLHDLLQNYFVTRDQLP